MRLTVISKNEKKKKINIVVVHSLDDAYKEAQNAMDNGFDKAVIEDEVHNTIFSCAKAKKTNFGRITESPEALAKWLEEKIGCFCDTYDGGDVDCATCPIADDCDALADKRFKILERMINTSDNISDKDYWLAWLMQESKE